MQIKKVASHFFFFLRKRLNDVSERVLSCYKSVKIITSCTCKPKDISVRKKKCTNEKKKMILQELNITEANLTKIIA